MLFYIWSTEDIPNSSNGVYHAYTALLIYSELKLQKIQIIFISVVDSCRMPENESLRIAADWLNISSNRISPDFNKDTQPI